MNNNKGLPISLPCQSESTTRSGNSASNNPKSSATSDILDSRVRGVETGRPADASDFVFLTPPKSNSSSSDKGNSPGGGTGVGAGPSSGSRSSSNLFGASSKGRPNVDTALRSSISNSSSPTDSPPVLENYGVKCDNCKQFGVKQTYQVGKRNYCSSRCSEMGKRDNSQVQVRTGSTAGVMASDEDMDGRSSRSSTPADEHGTIRSSSSASNSVNDYDAEGAPKKKKKKVEIDPTFDWKTMIESDPDFKAASVGLMKHAPLSRMWDNVTIGMKLEVENKDIDPRNHQIAFWVASVVKIQGYMVLLRFEGFGNDPSGDFWINLCSHDVHHVGWCANKGKPLIPPRSISRKFNDWRNFLVNRLTGARTLPQNFQAKVQSSLKSKYEVGDRLEVVDKNRICRLRLATVRKIVGRRLHVEYYDSVDDGGFWCHEESRLIHPKGWAKTMDHEILAPKDYNPEMLLPTPYDAEFEQMDLQVGMKLEAIDPLNLSAICAATIKKVLRRGYVMVRVDCYEEDCNSNGFDWFCYHISSPYVFPCGFCQENGIVLTPPYGYEKNNFSWDEYLEETGTRRAPVKQKKSINHKFRPGMKVEAADLMDPRLICVATISNSVGRLLKIHFDGWEEEYDQWLDARSPDIYPVGWCELVNHKLEAPRAPPKPMQPVKKGKKGKKGKAGGKTGKVGGPGRPAKNPPTAATMTTSNTSAGLSASKRKVPQTAVPVASTPNTVETVPIKPEPTPVQISSRRSSFQQQAEQLLMKNAAAASDTCATKNESKLGNSNVNSGPVNNLSNTKIQLGEASVAGSSVETFNGGTHSVIPVTDESTKNSNGNGGASPTSANSNFIIPRLTDNPSCCENVDPLAWGPQEVVEFLNKNDCGIYSDGFFKNKITGQTLMSLTKDQIVILTGMKVGPALKVQNFITQLKKFVTTAKARNNALGK